MHVCMYACMHVSTRLCFLTRWLYDDKNTHPLMYDDNTTHPLMCDDNNKHMHQQQTAVLKLPAHDFTPLAPLPPNANADIRYTSTD